MWLKREWKTETETETESSEEEEEGGKGEREWWVGNSINMPLVWSGLLFFYTYIVDRRIRKRLDVGVGGVSEDLREFEMFPFKQREKKRCEDVWVGM